MRKYRCIKPLVIQQYDEEGFHMPGQAITIEAGMMFKKRGQLMLAVPPAVRLEGADGLWLELSAKTVEAHFEEVE